MTTHDIGRTALLFFGNEAACQRPTYAVPQRQRTRIACFYPRCICIVKTNFHLSYNEETNFFVLVGMKQSKVSKTLGIWNTLVGDRNGVRGNCKEIVNTNKARVLGLAIQNSFAKNSARLSRIDVEVKSLHCSYTFWDVEPWHKAAS